MVRRQKQCRFGGGLLGMLSAQWDKCHLQGGAMACLTIITSSNVVGVKSKHDDMYMEVLMLLPFPLRHACPAACVIFFTRIWVGMRSWPSKISRLSALKRSFNNGSVISMTCRFLFGSVSLSVSEVSLP